MPKPEPANLPASWPATTIEAWPIDRPKPRPDNPRTHTAEQVEQIAAAMREWGWTNPILVDELGGIIAGHGRVLAARSLQYEHVPVMVARGWSQAQIRAYVIADNKLALNAGWDDQLLKAELSALEAEDFDLGVVGFNEGELDALFNAEAEGGVGETEEDDVPAVAKVAITRPGDIWVCGEHRVMCGDARKEDTMAVLVDGKAIAACWTDPPYNVNYEGGAGKIQNDAKPAERFRTLLRQAFQSALKVMEKGAPIYVAHADTEGLAFRAEFEAAGFKLAGCLIWRKQSIVLGHSDYQWQHEPILYGWKPGAGHRWYGDRKESTIRDAGGQLFEQREDGSWIIYLNDTALVVKGDNLTVAIEQGSVITEPKPARSSEHPTMKPVQLIERMIRNSTKVGDRVLDMFGGSGSTLIACHKLKRIGYILELDPVFCDVIVKRWEEYAGQPAYRLRDGAMFGTAGKKDHDARPPTPTVAPPSA